ncbi:MAG TPA: FMN-binding negative transcriptional regulator [Gemmatimonadales bacterium]|nr:FMN-binding negative transcriptional regulator [Gemmatimonadales bacterium]
MYIPHRFRNTDLAAVKAFLAAHSFGILVNVVDGKLWGTHIPLELDVDPAGREVLYGHVARANPQWRAVGPGREVLAIFTGPDAYVSSSVYAEPDTPTWNYVAVHVRGEVELLEAEETREVLRRLLAKYERDSARPVTLEGLPERVQHLVNGIVAFKVVVRDIEAAFKLSQNRDARDHAAVVAALEQRGDPGAAAMAEAMRADRGR